MNKGMRHQIKMLKFKKRLKNYRLTNEVGNFFAFRSHGKPCSCFVCQQVEDNYNRMAFKKEALIVIKDETQYSPYDETPEFEREDILETWGLVRVDSEELRARRNPAYQYLV